MDRRVRSTDREQVHVESDNDESETNLHEDAMSTIKSTTNVGNPRKTHADEFDNKHSASTHNVTFSDSNIEINIEPSISSMDQSSDTTGRSNDIRNKTLMNKGRKRRRKTSTDDDSDIMDLREAGLVSKSNISLDFYRSQIEIGGMRRSGVRRVCMRGEICADQQFMKATQTTRVVQASSKYMDILEALWALLRTLLALLLLVSFIFFAFTSGPTLLSFHVIFMALGWIYLMTYGLNVFSTEHFMIQVVEIRNKQTKHWILQVTCIIFAIVGLVAAFMHKYEYNINHCNTWHDIIGLTSFASAIVNAFGGLLTYKISRRRRSVGSLIIILFHTLLGLLTYTSGVGSIVMIFLDDWWDGGYVCLYVYLALLGFHLVCTIFRPLVKFMYRIKVQIQDNY